VGQNPEEYGVTRFSDLSEYVAIPAVTSLALSPDGTWLAASVQSLGPEPKKHVSSIWRIAADGAPPVRLTRSAEGESGPRFLADGSLLFVSKRPEPTVKADSDGDGDRPALWLLPAGGGEARRVCAPPGGAGGTAVARTAPAFLLAAAAFPGSEGFEADAGRRKARSEAGVTAILHDGGLLRYWDHDLGPDCVRLLTGQVSDTEAEPIEVRDLTPDPGRSLDEQAFALSPDGTRAVTGWEVPEQAGGTRTTIVVIDVSSGQRRTLLSAPGVDFTDPVVSPDGTMVAAIRSEHDSYQRPGDVTLVVAALSDSNDAENGDGNGDGAEATDLLPGFDRRPLQAEWAPEGAVVYFTADDNGRRPIFAVSVGTGKVRAVTSDDAAYESLCPAKDGGTLYALRSAIDEPPTPVRIDLTDLGAAPVRLPSPAGELPVPGRVEEVSATEQDGVTVRGWLALPDEASAEHPVPLLLWVHGGPVMSWNAWSWRWNPWLMAARGYAVLLPDPALSTGYGHAFIERGHGTWGDRPFTDVMAITDVVAARPDIDPSRTAMMGGSFGGYMANWIAGHTTRFRAVVSHAGLWALDQMFGTTDNPAYWRRMFGHPVTEPERYLANSPHLHADAISTPLLIIHGDRDYRVPISEALRLYADLLGSGKQIKFLYFPDENHWVLKPGDVKVWYETVLAFLGEHVLGEQWQRPELV